jgi:hypothetical protein
VVLLQRENQDSQERGHLEHDAGSNRSLLAARQILAAFLELLGQVGTFAPMMVEEGLAFGHALDRHGRLGPLAIRRNPCPGGPVRQSRQNERPRHEPGKEHESPAELLCEGAVVRNGGHAPITAERDER